MLSEKITVPTLGESVTEATVSKWLKNEGEYVEVDEPVVELETDKDNQLKEDLETYDIMFSNRELAINKIELKSWK